MSLQNGMSGLCKVEMSAFMGARGPMETERIALSQRERDRLRVLHEVQQKADHADRSRQAAEDQRSPYPSATARLGEHGDRAVIHDYADEDQTAD